jgi:hypothetical protein
MLFALAVGVLAAFCLVAILRRESRTVEPDMPADR